MIPFMDLAAQQKLIHPKLERRIREVLSHGKYIMGPEIDELEEKLAQYVDIKHTISCSSCTDALLMILMAYGVGQGDAIFTTPFTFIATAEVISLLGATPIFVDIDPRTFNIDPLKLETAVKAVKESKPNIHPIPRALKQQLTPRGVIAVDVFGLPADYGRINAVAKANGLFVVEDAAQSFGATCEGKKACALTDSAATSFFPAKPLGCYGDGGAVLTDDDKLASTIRSIRQHGKGKEKYDNVRIGINGRLHTLQAAILLEKFEIFPQEVIERNRVADLYSKGLDGFLDIPFIPDGCSSVWAQYSIMSDRKEKIQMALKNSDIPTAIYYPKPLHLQTAFSHLGYITGDFSISEKTSERIFSLPMHPYLADDQIEMIVKVIRSSLSN